MTTDCLSRISNFPSLSENSTYLPNSDVRSADLRQPRCLMDDPILTTGEAALLLGVSIRTVQTWIEQDVIDSWKTPGGHRRVRRSAVLALRERLIARNDEAVIPLLVLTDGESGLQPMELLRLVPNARITTCGDALSFLIEAGHQKPDVLIIEIAHSDWGRLAMLRRILQSRPLAHARIVLITTMHLEQIKIDVGDHPRMQVLPPTHSQEQLLEAISLPPQRQETGLLTYPVPTNEESRLRALEKSHVLTRGEQHELNDIVIAAAELLQMPIALVTILSSDRQWFKARHGLTVTDTPRAWAFCNYTIMQEGIFVVEDALLDQRFSSNPLVTEEPSIRFYAGIAIRDADGYPLGALCVLDRHPRSIASEQQDKLVALARLASEKIDQYAYQS